MFHFVSLRFTGSRAQSLAARIPRAPPRHQPRGGQFQVGSGRCGFCVFRCFQLFSRDSGSDLLVVRHDRELGKSDVSLICTKFGTHFCKFGCDMIFHLGSSSEISGWFIASKLPMRQEMNLSGCVPQLQLCSWDRTMIPSEQSSP